MEYVAAGFAPRARAEGLADLHFRYGSLRACLRTDDEAFRSRFATIFSDCLEPEPSASEASPVVLQVTGLASKQKILADIGGHAGRGDSAALIGLFPGLRELPSRGEGQGPSTSFAWGDDATPVISMCAERVVLDRAIPWQMIITHYFLNHLMRLQPALLFFHAASLAIGGRGVFLGGPKGAGKSTLSLSLAARGHGFLGDEVAAIDSRTGEMLPCARAVSIREGPQAQAVHRFLERTRVERETLPDGTKRLRVPASQVFPAARPRRAKLAHAFFLDTRARAPQTKPLHFSTEHLPLLSPLHATLGGIAAGARAVRFLGLFGTIPCHVLTPGGTPDETAELIERTVQAHGI